MKLQSLSKATYKIKSTHKCDGKAINTDELSNFLNITTDTGEYK